MSQKKLFLGSFFGAIAVAAAIAGLLFLKEKLRLSDLEDKFTDWTRISGKVASYEARFPLESEQREQTIPIPNSDQSIEQEIFTSSGTDMTYVLITSKYPADITGDEEENLRASLDGMVKAVPRAELVSSKYIVPFLGNNFLEFLIRDTANNSFIKGRLILKPRHLYQIYSSYVKETYDKDAFDYFVNFFDIK